MLYISDIPLFICNDLHYGYIPIPLEEDQALINDQDQILNVKLFAISRGEPLPLLTYFSRDMEYPDMWNYGCDKIFMINLARRTERKQLMMQSFKELGMAVTIIEAVDGQYVLHSFIIFKDRN